MSYKSDSKFSNSTFNSRKYNKHKSKQNDTITSGFSNFTPLSELPIDTKIEPSDNTVSRV